MSLYRTMVTQGEVLFINRGWLPLFFLVPFSFALQHSEWLEVRFGDSIDDLWDWMCVGLSLVGLLVRVLVAGTVPRRTSGRNTKKGQGADSLNTTGIYSLIRHPLYLGNFLIFLGVCLTPAVWWIALLGTAVFWLYYERIILAEEAFLSRTFGQAFDFWSQSVPAILPRFYGWRPSSLPFCWKTALKREYLSCFAMVACFTIIDYAEDVIAAGYRSYRFELEHESTILFLVSIAFFVVVRFVRKNTKLLSVAGR